MACACRSNIDAFLRTYLAVRETSSRGARDHSKGSFDDDSLSQSGSIGSSKSGGKSAVAAGTGTAAGQQRSSAPKSGNNATVNESAVAASAAAAVPPAAPLPAELLQHIKANNNRLDCVEVRIEQSCDPVSLVNCDDTLHAVFCGELRYYTGFDTLL